MVPTQDKSPHPAGKHFQFELPCEHLLQRVLAAGLDESLNVEQGAFLGAIEPSPAEPFGAILDAVDCQGGNILAGRGQSRSKAGKEPAAEGRGLPDDLPVGLEEDGGPANPVAAGGPGGCHRSQIAPAVNWEQWDFPGQQGDVGNAAAVAIARYGGDGRGRHANVFSGREGSGGEPFTSPD